MTQGEVRDPPPSPTAHVAANARPHEPAWSDWAAEVNEAMGLSPVAHNTPQPEPVNPGPGDIPVDPTPALTNPVPSNPAVDPDPTVRTGTTPANSNPIPNSPVPTDPAPINPAPVTPPSPQSRSAHEHRPRQLHPVPISPVPTTLPLPIRPRQCRR